MTTSPPNEGPANDVIAEWIEPHLSTVFSRWHTHIERLQQATTRSIIAAAGVRPGQQVIDVGCGSGIPALQLAETVGPAGHVVATDPSPVFIAAVVEHAARRGLSNISAVQSSAAGLPFARARFDAATCHMGAMFFPDLNAGLNRIRAVLRPGGRAAFVAWGPIANNQLFGTFWGAAGPYLPSDTMNEPHPDTPQPMRFARPGSLTAALRTAGYSDVDEETQNVELVWPSRSETMRDFWFELTGLDEKVSTDRRDALREDVRSAFATFERNGELSFTADVVLASGRA